MDYIQQGLTQYSLIFKSPIDILHHMFCVLGNGINSKTFSIKKNSKNHYSISAEYFDNLTPECVPCFLYPYDETPIYQPFMQYADVKNKQNALGLQSAMRYFIKCLEMSTFELLIERKKTELMRSVKDLDLPSIIDDMLQKRNVDISSMSSIQLEKIEELKSALLKSEEDKIEMKMEMFISNKEEIEKTLNDWKMAIPLMKKQFNIE